MHIILLLTHTRSQDEESSSTLTCWAWSQERRWVFQDDPRTSTSGPTSGSPASSTSAGGSDPPDSTLRSLRTHRDVRKHHKELTSRFSIIRLDSRAFLIDGRCSNWTLNKFTTLFLNATFSFLRCGLLTASVHQHWINRTKDWTQNQQTDKHSYTMRCVSRVTLCPNLPEFTQLCRGGARFIWTQ